MKTFLTLIVLTFLSTSLFAGEKYGDFVQTKDNVYFLKNVRLGVSSFLVGTMENGEKIKFAKGDVLVYKMSGERFEKMPLVKDNVCQEETCFMKVIAYKCGLKVYKHEYYDQNGELTSRHYIFKKDEFVVKFDRENTPNLTAFFAGELN